MNESIELKWDPTVRSGFDSLANGIAKAESLLSDSGCLKPCIHNILRKQREMT